jgi:hypothetical protein
VSAHEDRKGLSIRAYEKGRELGKTVNNDFLPGKKINLPMDAHFFHIFPPIGDLKTHSGPIP